MNATESDWTIQQVVYLNGQTLSPGTKILIVGERGTFTYLRFVTRPDGHCWLDTIGGQPGCTKFRSFRPERVGGLA